MAKLIKEGKKDLSILSKAESLVKYLPPKDWLSQAKAIFHFVRDDIRYLNDIYGIETVRAAPLVLSRGQGDCDDKAVLAGALLQSIGHPVRLTAAGFNSKPLSHVFISTLIGTQWFPLELTEQLRFGELPHGITTMMVENVSLK